jgi:hypothetical protein
MGRDMITPAQYFVFVRAADGWAVLHRDHCRFVVGRTESHPCIGRWVGRYESRIVAMQTAQDQFGCRVRACRNCKA